MRDRKARGLFLVGLLAALLLAGVVSQFASDEPDGLEYVAEQEGFADRAEEHDLADSPLADYGEGLTGSRGFDTAVAGLVGVLVTLALGSGVFWLARRTRPDRTEPTSPA